MAKNIACFKWMTSAAELSIHPHYNHCTLPAAPTSGREQHESTTTTKTFASKSLGFSLDSVIKRCQTCRGQGAIECSGCKGSGKNKKNGNIFERWKCFDCQGFGLKSCPSCGKEGLTPEQRGER